MSATPTVTAPAKRVAIVTGAAGDLGRAIALRLASDGLSLSITDLPWQSSKLSPVAEQIRAKGAKCYATTGDVSITEDVDRIVAETVRELGGVDVIVANAGVLQPGSLLELTPAEFLHHISNDSLSCLLRYQAAARQMVLQHRGGRKIGGCSVAGLTGAALCSAYIASKFAIRGLTMCAALELAGEGITVNAYAPGFVEGTEMMDIFADQGSAMMGLTPEQWRVAATGLFPMKRLDTPEEIGDVVSYFASPEAGWTTGKIWAVDGGMHMS